MHPVNAPPPPPPPLPPQSTKFGYAQPTKRGGGRVGGLKRVKIRTKNDLHFLELQFIDYWHLSIHELKF